MNPHSRLLLSHWIQRPISRRALLASAGLLALANSKVGKAIGATAPVYNIILGRPTRNSIAISILASESMSTYIEYGYAPGRYTLKTKSIETKTQVPTEIELTGLQPNARVYYRVRYRGSAAKTYKFGKQRSFSTAKDSGSEFTFTIQGDTHPERAGKMFNAALYQVTLSNIAEQQPDFHILIGDDFSIDPLISKGNATRTNVEKVYRTHREWLSMVGSTVPLFLINGNHEQAAGYLLDGSETNPAILAGRARLKYFPLPEPNNFYTGNTVAISGLGLPRDYYSWTWGDALFVTLDPYWHSPNPVDNVAGASAAEDQGETKTKAKKSGGKSGGGQARDLWKIGIGDAQYQWLKETLEGSEAKFKFVFAHHVMGTGRGGVELSSDYEWGGNDPKGTTTFEKERPNWELPIHDLMVKNKVSIFFQGHDHIFVTQERDGIIYQSLPNPADDTFSYFNESAYKTGVKAPNSGHVRVRVNSTETLVEYFLAANEKETGRSNLQLAHSYRVLPRA